MRSTYYPGVCVCTNSGARCTKQALQKLYLYIETFLNQTLCNLKPSLNWMCFQVLLSIFAVHIELF